VDDPVSVAGSNSSHPMQPSMPHCRQVSVPGMSVKIMEGEGEEEEESAAAPEMTRVSAETMIKFSCSGVRRCESRVKGIGVSIWVSRFWFCCFCLVMNR